MHTINHTSCQICNSDNISLLFPIKDHSISKEIFEISRCHDCGFTFTNKVPVESECGKYYQSEDYISHSDTSAGLVFKLYHLVRNIMLKRKYNLIEKLKTPRSLLDVGSGTGYFLDFMKNKGYNTIGVEMDEKARNFSIDHFKLKVLPPDHLSKDLLRETFGCITLWHVLEHLYDPNAYFNIFYKILEENGNLIIAVPNHESYDAAHYKEYWAAYDVPRHLWHFTPDTMEKIAKKNNFRIISKKNMPFDPFYNSILSEKYKNSLFSLVKGACIGFISMLNGMFNVNKASSVIYVMEKM